MISGVLCPAGRADVGLIFVGPLIVPEYPAALQSTGRYLALGLIALPLARSVVRVYVSSTAVTG